MIQALKCDICRQVLRGLAFELITLRGDAVASFDGTTAIAHREAARLLQLCDACGDWLQVGMRSVRDSFQVDAS